MALELFETDFEELAGTPSTRSADNEVEVMVVGLGWHSLPTQPTTLSTLQRHCPPAQVQADRSQALAAALEKGYITGYSGWRRSFQGTRFLIKDAILFNVMSPTGRKGWQRKGRYGSLGLLRQRPRFVHIQNLPTALSDVNHIIILSTIDSPGARRRGHRTGRAAQRLAKGGGRSVGGTRPLKREESAMGTARDRKPVSVNEKQGSTGKEYIGVGGWGGRLEERGARAWVACWRPGDPPRRLTPRWRAWT